MYVRLKMKVMGFRLYPILLDGKALTVDQKGLTPELALELSSL